MNETIFTEEEGFKVQNGFKMCRKSVAVVLAGFVLLVGWAGSATALKGDDCEGNECFIPDQLNRLIGP